MKTHADFKRALAAENTRLETLALANGLPGNDSFYVGQVRKVVKRNTTGVYLEDDKGNGSWLDYDKAGEWNIHGDIATHTAGMSYRVIFGDTATPTLGKLFCEDCGRNFIHYLKGLPQRVCGYCAGEDMGGQE